MTRLLVAALCGLPLTVPALAQDAAPDPAEIVRRSVQRDQENYRRLQNYTFLERSEETRYTKEGETTSTDSETDEVLMLAGRPYYRVVAKDGKPLSEKDARKEQEKLDKELAKRLKDPEKDHAKYEKERAEERRFLLEIPDAFDLTLLGQDEIDGIPAWKIHAEPRPDYEPKEKQAKNLKKVRGTFWIDQNDYQWVKAELEVIDTISWGWFVLRIPPGATITFSQTRVNDEVWLPEHIHVRADARVALLKKFRVGIDVTYRDYRRFSTESEIVNVEEVEQ